MLPRLLLGLLAAASLTLAGCAHSPQHLSLQPMDDHDTSRRFTFMARTARGQQLLAAVRA